MASHNRCINNSGRTFISGDGTVRLERSGVVRTQQVRLGQTHNALAINNSSGNVSFRRHNFN